MAATTIQVRVQMPRCGPRKRYTHAASASTTAPAVTMIASFPSMARRDLGRTGRMQILVTGATGAVGRPLAVALDRAGHTVVAATRHPDRYEGVGRAVAFDLDGGGEPRPLADLDPDGVASGCEAAYYLVHALDDPDFADLDRRRAQRFADWWGPDRTLVYLGGLGSEETASARLRPPHQTAGGPRAPRRTPGPRAAPVSGA